MGGGHHGEGITYKGLTLHQPKRWHVVTGKGLCAVMWFWVLYRAKQDGPVVLGWRHPWEGHDDHGHGHGHYVPKDCIPKEGNEYNWISGKDWLNDLPLSHPGKWAKSAMELEGESDR